MACQKYVTPLLILFACSGFSQTKIDRQDVLIGKASGQKIHIRQLTSSSLRKDTPVLLLHGGGGSSVASFDPGIPEFSLAENLASTGYTVYLLNLRGWERSDRPKELDSPPQNNPPLITTDDAESDIQDAVNWICDKERKSSVILFGWASGGHWAACFTSRHPQQIHSLVLLNTMYGVDAPWKIGEGSNPDEVEAYRLADAQSLTRRWESSVPPKQKNDWWDPAVIKAYQEHVLQSDPTSAERNPPSVRIPLGYWKEHLEMSRGKKFYNAADIQVPTLMIRSGRDFWSRPEDVAAFKEDFSDDDRLQVVEIKEGTHFLFFDKPEKGRTEFLNTLLAFLNR